MSTEVLSDKDAATLFNQISKAVQNDDSDKLSTLMNPQASVEDVEVPVVEDKPANVSDDVQPDDDNKEETPDPLAEDKPADDNANDKDDTKPVEKSELDILKEKLAKAEKDNHSLRSQAGRIPHVQRRIQELDKKLEELAKSKTSPSSQTSTKIQPKVLELLKGLKETDSELADTIANAIEAATNGVADEMLTKEEGTLRLLREQEFQTYQEHETNRLLEMYPNAPEVFRSPSWAEWKNEQSERVLGLATSNNADDVSFAFKKYAEDMIAKYPELAKVEDKVVADATPPASATSEAAKKVEAERQRRKETAVNVSNPSAAGKVGLPDDPEALFKKFSEEIRKERTG